MPVLLLCHLVSSINGFGNMIQVMWGIPHESRIQKAHMRSLAQYSQTRLQRCLQGVVLPVDAKNTKGISTEYRNKLLSLSFTSALGLPASAIMEENELRINTGKNVAK